MAWYYGTFACGCKGRVNITGPTKNRQYLADKRFNGSCEICWGKHLEEERDRKNKEAEEKAKEMELKVLTGTEKQVAWANTLRQKLIDKFDIVLERTGEEIFIRTCFKEEYQRKIESLEKIERLLKEAIEEDIEQRIERYKRKIENIKESMNELEKETFKKENIVLVLNYILDTFTSSEFFIDNREKEVYELIEKHKNEALKTDEQKFVEKHEKDLEEELKKEATVYPEDRITDAVVVLEKDDDVLKAKFEKNEKFREIVKYHNLYWKDNCWKRIIDFKSGTVEDRMAELGNELLNEGFPIRIMDEKTRENAINGEYEKEQSRWISKRVTGKYAGRLCITWNGYSEKLYRTARTLPGSIWNDGVLVKVEHANEVEEFATLYNFKFSPGATEMIDAYKENLKNSKVVSPVKVEKEEQKDGLKEILNSSTEVLDDLKDED